MVTAPPEFLERAFGHSEIQTESSLIRWSQFCPSRKYTYTECRIESSLLRAFFLFFYFYFFYYFKPYFS